MMRLVANKTKVVMDDEDYLVGNKIISYETEYDTIFMLINQRGECLQTI